MNIAHQVATRWKEAKGLDLKLEGLSGLAEGRPVTLYHGTTRTFRTFSMDMARDELVNNYYGRGFFFTPSKRVAEKYAYANRNFGLPPSVIGLLKSKNPGAGEFLQVLVDHGKAGWEKFYQDHGLLRDENSPEAKTKGQLDWEAFNRLLGGVDPNDIGDLAGYILGSKTKPLGMGEDNSLEILMGGGGMSMDFVYKILDNLGLPSNVYRPKVYTVSVTCSNPLITKSKSLARKAPSKGYDSVVYYGPDIVDGVTEVAVYDPRKVKVRHIEVV